MRTMEDETEVLLIDSLQSMPSGAFSCFGSSSKTSIDVIRKENTKNAIVDTYRGRRNKFFTMILFVSVFMYISTNSLLSSKMGIDYIFNSIQEKTLKKVKESVKYKENDPSKRYGNPAPPEAKTVFIAEPTLHYHHTTILPFHTSSEKQSSISKLPTLGVGRISTKYFPMSTTTRLTKKEEIPTSVTPATRKYSENVVQEPNGSNNTNKETTVGCNFPKLTPKGDPSVRALANQKWEPASCTKNYDLIFEIGEDYKSIVNVHELRNQERNWTDCCYRVITRGFADMDSRNPDNQERLSTKCWEITKNSMIIPPEHEFIAVFCKSTKLLKNESYATPTMIDAFPFVPLKKSVEDKIFRITKPHRHKQRSKRTLNLVIFGIDAVSHMNFQRTMPKSLEFMRTNLSALWMDGFTKIGDNTYPNLLATLASYNTTEAEKDCVVDQKFDDCPFIWKNFSAHGYRTSFSEDSPWMGAFNYLKKGFQYPPTDYYLRPFSRAVEGKIKNDKQGNAYVCYGPRMSFEVLLNYMRSMALTMESDKRYFQLTWATSLTHDYVNSGKNGDAPLLKFLKFYRENKNMNDNTIFILMSDHGIRWGPMRALPQGKIEESMPFIYFVFPKWFRMKYSLAMKNMLENRQHLTTPFDTYETLMDILLLENIEDSSIRRRTESLNSLTEELPRGISLFLPVPKTRTCAMAQIQEHWCVCHTSVKLSVQSIDVQQAANFAVYQLNSRISNFSDCAFLSLEAVLSAQLIVPETIQKDKTIKESIYELAFKTNPGNGFFDATVVKTKGKGWKLSGPISRTNLYGNQSHCVNDKEMKLYCYCLTQLI